MSAEIPYHAFSVYPTAAPLNVSQQTYLAQHPDSSFSYIATGALVFDKREASTPRIPLLQRDISDSMPGRWEIPGGACDEIDESILHAAARELWEETGLQATQVGPQVGEALFFITRSGKNICKFYFLVEIHTDSLASPDVKLDPAEHQQYLWATESEVQAHKVGDVSLKFTTQDMERTVLEAFVHMRDDHDTET